MSGQQNAQKEQKERVRILRKAGITEADAEKIGKAIEKAEQTTSCLLYTSPSPRDCS